MQAAAGDPIREYVRANLATPPQGAVCSRLIAAGAALERIDATWRAQAELGRDRLRDGSPCRHLLRDRLDHAGLVGVARREVRMTAAPPITFGTVVSGTCCSPWLRRT